MNTAEKQAFALKFKAAIKADDKNTILDMMKPVIDDLAERIMAGTLIKNIRLHLNHRGITGKCCDMITEIAQIRAERFMHYKAK